MTKKILVTAATGDTGRYVVRLLLEKGYKVRALAHSQDVRSEALAKSGAEVVFGDLLDLPFVTEATKDIYGAYFCYPIKPGIIQATAYFAQAAEENGLSGIVNMSQISASRDSKSHVAQDHWIAEQVFNWSGVTVTHIRPTYFAEWLLYLAPMISQGVMNVPFKIGKHAPIACEDQARVIVNILDDPKPHAGKVYPLFGPVEFTHEELAKEVGKALGIDIQYQYVDFDAFLQLIKSAAQPRAEHTARAMYGALEEGKAGQEAAAFLGQHLGEVALDHMNGVFAGTNDVVLKIGGVKGTTVKEFIEKNRQAFDVKRKA